VKETSIEKRRPAAMKERGQYALAFGIIALMLYVAGFPLFLLFFVGVLTFFIWKVFSSERRNDTRRIFEFYLTANEILRDDDRRWFGFEIQDAIVRGEMIVKSMTSAPPLVHFALGALYQKIGDHTSAIKNLTPVVESSDEIKIIFPTNELRDYVRVLRKIERAPAEAPLTSAAIRSLERARKNRALALLNASRAQIDASPAQIETAENPDEIRAKRESVIDITSYRDDDADANERDPERASRAQFVDVKDDNSDEARDAHTPHKDRKTISEVLHDIYDANIG
jgi:hypothetical protein